MSIRSQSKWTIEQAQEWFKTLPWICGCNFLPSSSVNFLEMWMFDTFDPDCINRELGWAAKVGFNAVRVNLHFLVWQHDRDGLFTRMEQVLALAKSHGVYVVFVPFDDCGFGGLEPKYDCQLPPVRGVHNSRAVASPGRDVVMKSDQWAALQDYITDVVEQFANDVRILFWDLYNEPGNRMIFGTEGFREYDIALEEQSLELMKLTFEWARSVGPAQPLTVGAWRTADIGNDEMDFDNVIDQTALQLSDIITFHAYLNRSRVAKCIAALSKFERPIFLTEWMARAVESRIDTHLDLLHHHHVGCFNWGLVQGRTQTHLPWPRPLLEKHGINPDQSVWFHDIFHPDGRAYDPAEIEILKKLTSSPKNAISAE